MASGKIKSFLTDLSVDIGMFFSAFIIYFPDGKLGNVLRGLYYRCLLGKALGKGPVFRTGAFIDTRYSQSRNIHIGDHFVAGAHVTIDPGDSFGIIIGNHVSLPQGVYVRAANHNYSSTDKLIRDQGHIAKKLTTADGRVASIIIEDDVMFGANAIVLSGARIGKGSVISAGSVVASEVPEYSVVAGNPARVIANRTKGQFMTGYEVFP